MALLTTAPRGTRDILPKDSRTWQEIEQILRETAELYGFLEIRTPVFEHTELFQRSVGETTDVVSKEMYTFTDKGDRSITLRPEGTAGVCRAVVENGLLGDALPLKVSYNISCFRYEKPQAGRLREFHQFGVEMFGAESPAADAEMIALARELLKNTGALDSGNIHLEINSIGCPTCRAEYHRALKKHFSAKRECLCGTCQERLEKNPMRILDCKSPVCQEIAADAPKILDYLCDDCRSHFEQVKNLLDAAGIEYEVNPTIVRGLDYYTRTVFEFVSTGIGAQGTVCGGGRYNGLVEEIGGPAVCGIGFAMGLERLLLTLGDSKPDYGPNADCDLFLISRGEQAMVKSFQLANQLREEGIAASSDLMGRSIKAQMKYANKINARYTLVIGETELETGEAQLKRMSDGSVTTVSIADVMKLEDALIQDAEAQDEEELKKLENPENWD